MAIFSAANELMCGHWTTGVVIELLCGYWTNTKKKLGIEKIVNTNTFFFIPMKKLSQSYAHMDSHDVTFEYSKCYYRAGLQFFGHTFLEGAGVLGC